MIVVVIKRNSSKIVDKLLGREKKILVTDYTDAKFMAQIFNVFL